MRGYCYRTPQLPCVVACTSVGSFLRHPIPFHADVDSRHPVICRVGLHSGFPSKKKGHNAPEWEAILQEQSAWKAETTEPQSVRV